MESGEFCGLLTGHRTPIRWASFSKDGSRLVTASADRMIKVWEGTSCVVTIPGWCRTGRLQRAEWEQELA